MVRIAETRPVLTVAEKLKHRAELYHAIREFFAQRAVLEVETPIFSPFANTDPHISSLAAEFDQQRLYAHTSPEFAMKRLLCEGSGDIYQLCKVFRLEEKGRLHNPEFTMLEWYRLGMDYRRLAMEVVELVNFVGFAAEPIQCSYQALFRDHVGVDILSCDASELRNCALENGLSDCKLGENIDAWSNYLLTHLIEPHLKNIPLLIIYDFPASQAALAQLSTHDSRTSLRFELYFKGVELANGYQELTDQEIYRQRFARENTKRKKEGLPEMPLDEELLSALKQGLPECAGVALGIDRLLMLLLGRSSLSEVAAFEV